MPSAPVWALTAALAHSSAVLLWTFVTSESEPYHWGLFMLVDFPGMIAISPLSRFLGLDSWPDWLFFLFVGGIQWAAIGWCGAKLEGQVVAWQREHLDTRQVDRVE